MTEITPVPESLRKAFEKEFPTGVSIAYPDYDPNECSEDLLQFIAAQRESAARERTEEILTELNRLRDTHFNENISGGAMVWAMVTLSDVLRDKFLSTSLTPEK